MSFASPPSDERRRQLADPRELRALAHPLRLALLDHLMSFGEQTAARCAEAVGSTTSNCSYHLRALGRAGFVERADSPDGRERPWRATATGLAYGQDDLEQLTRQARRRNDQQPADWRAAEAYHDYGLYITAAELADLTAQIDHLVRPYIAMARRNAPEDAEVAILRLLAFRHPQTP
jgi:DNA-binding MarR family transcriptional regulator